MEYSNSNFVQLIDETIWQNAFGGVIILFNTDLEKWWHRELEFISNGSMLNVAVFDMQNEIYE